MSSEIPQKIGRGGAGNFYTKKDVEDALKQSEDLEAQNQTSSRPLEPQSHAPSYLRSGRGGAGNFISPTDAPVSTALKSLPSRVPSDKATSSYRGHSGRGGAGNWGSTDGEEERKRREQAELEVKNKVNEKVRLDVEKGLKAPPKAYTGP